MPKRSDAVFVLITVVVCLSGLELAYRAISGVPVLRLLDWRTVKFLQFDGFTTAEYDPTVGWVMKAGLTSPAHNTIDHGIRKNAASDTTIRPGGILVVGDSFSAGGEVNDDQSWPAHLEALTGLPV